MVNLTRSVVILTVNWWKDVLIWKRTTCTVIVGEVVDILRWKTWKKCKRRNILKIFITNFSIILKRIEEKTGWFFSYKGKKKVRANQIFSDISNYDLTYHCFSFLKLNYLIWNYVMFIVFQMKNKMEICTYSICSNYLQIQRFRNFVHKFYFSFFCCC